MAKITLSTILSQFASITSLNANFAAIAAAFENTLSRDGTSPNNMEADLDMDSNRILNLPEATNATEPTRLSQTQELIANAGFDWRGPWALSTSYIPNEIVQNDGSVYIAILTHTSDADSEPGVGVDEATYWDLLSSKGDQGETGNDGNDGADGVFTGAESTVTPAANDRVALLDDSDSDNPKFALFSDFGGSSGGAPLRTTLSRASTGQTISTATWTVMAWDTEVDDTVPGGGGDIGTDANRITVPSGYTKCRVNAYIVWDNNSSGGRRIAIQKNNDATLDSADVLKFISQNAVNETGMNVFTEVIDVTPGDHFSIWVQQDSGGNRTVQGTGFGGPSVFTVEFWADDS